MCDFYGDNTRKKADGCFSCCCAVRWPVLFRYGCSIFGYVLALETPCTGVLFGGSQNLVFFSLSSLVIKIDGD